MAKESKTKKEEQPQEDIQTELETKVIELEAQLDESKDKYLRLFAEFDNFKKRNIKERIDLRANAAAETLTALLPVLDDFDRAKKSADDPDSEEKFSEGVSLVYEKIYKIVEGMGLTTMDTQDQPFDPELHEAITEIPAPSDDLKGKVVDTVEKGYKLNDKIIRYAKVVVGN